MFHPKLLLCALFVLFMVEEGLGQYDDPVEYTMPEDLNTIGFNLTPAAILVMNSQQFSPRWSVFYKRQTAPNHKYRFQYHFESREKYELLQYESPLAWSDTTITLAYDTRNHRNQDLRVGIEFFNPLEKNTMIYGFDVGVGIWEEFDERVEVPYWNDPELNNQPVPSPFEASSSSYADVTWGYFVADFSIGHKFTTKKQFNFIVQWTPEVIYQWPVAENYSSLIAREDPPTDAFFFRLRGIELYMNIVF
ncbi:MAG: hypothetical protein P8H59_07010 [Flavobacteriales bacterium]|nr:hypothetical protein [Flavobacteriales bacterium]